jgi:hypothetical protein
MRFTSQVFAAVCTAALLFVLPGCTKEYKYIHDHPGEEIKLCQLESISILTMNPDKLGEAPPDSVGITINYNTAGNPVSMISSSTESNSTDGVNFYFRYDKYGRLTDYITTYVGETGAIIWKRYFYPDNKTIVDSTFDYVGDISNPVPPASSFDTYVDVYKLDGQGRVIKDIETFPSSGVTDYVYNAEGNLVRDGARYDNKVNPYRTNKVWMLTNLDYSVNNPLVVAQSTDPLQILAYNAYGLPLEYTGAFLFGYSNIYIAEFPSNMKLQYACDAGQSGLLK